MPDLQSAWLLLLFCACSHVVRAGDAEGNQTLLLGRQGAVSHPHRIFRPELANARRPSPGCVPQSGLAAVEQDVRMLLKVQGQQVKHSKCPLWRCGDINVIEAGQQELVCSEVALHLGTKRAWGSPFAAFRLPTSVMPHNPGGGGVKLAHNGHASVGSGNIAQCLQHGLAADVIKSANPVHRQNGGIRVGLRPNQQAWATASVPARVERAN